jgi:peptide chain release factor subunit 1
MTTETFPSAVDLTRQLRRLADLEPSELPVLSIYLDMRPQATGQRPGRRAGLIVLRDRMREIERTYWPRGADYDSFTADRERIDEFLGQQLDESAQGVAIFACSGDGLWETVTSGVPFRDSVSAGPLPDLFQLARLIDEHEAAVAALVDSNTCRLFVTRTGRLSEVGGPDDASVSYRKRSLGGWSEQRYQRHIDEHIASFAEESAQAIAQLVDREGARRVLLAGDEVAITPLEERLPAAVRDKVDEVLRIDIRASHDELSDEVRAVLARLEAESSASAADTLIAAVRSGGLGVVGLEGTHSALQAGAAEVLVLAGLPGQDADKTEHADARDLAHQGQQLSDAEPGLLDLDIRNELVRLAAATSCAVEVVNDHQPFNRAGGVGAILRYRLPPAG